jgi:flagellar motor switch protein FliN
MSSPITHDAIIRLLVDEFARVWGIRLGGTAAIAPSGDAQGLGWIVTTTMSGATAGRVSVWIDRDAASACTKKSLALDRDPQEPEVAGFLRDIVTEAIAALGQRSELGGIFWTETAAALGAATPGLRLSYLAIANVASCVVGVSVEGGAPAAEPAYDHRLDAVLDVDLPVVVRFGRAVMPLKSLAELGPGSVVDMGRSPDEPVELLVGERVIARGEVVVVSGNYGVRITELTRSRYGATEMEARLS